MKGVRSVLLHHHHLLLLLFLPPILLQLNPFLLRQLLNSFSDRLCSLSLPHVAQRARSLPLLLTHIILNSHVLPYVRDKLVLNIGGDEIYLSDLKQLLLSKMR